MSAPRSNIKRGPSGTLCTTCKNGVTTYRGTDEPSHIYCHEMSAIRQPPQPVTQCSAYIETHSLTEEHFYRIGWQLRTDKMGKSIGFQPPKKDTVRFGPLPGGGDDD